MRRALCALLPLLLAAPLGAQGFEGAVTMKMAPAGATEAVTSTLFIKGSMVALIMTLPASAGPGAGMEAHMIFDQSTQKMTMLMPLPPGTPGMAGVKGMKIVTDFSEKNAAPSKASEPTIKKLGTSQTIAGMRCDDYQTTSDGESVNLCVTDKLGRFTLPTNPRTKAPAWTHAFGDKPAFPLKVWSTKQGGGVVMEVTGIQRGPVTADKFDTNPAGYRDMSAMMGGMGRNSN